MCRRHGGAAPQVLIAAGLRWREWAVLQAEAAWQDAGGQVLAGDSRSVALSGDLTRARRDLAEYQDSLDDLAELRRRRWAQAGGSRQPRGPDGRFTARQ